MVVIIANLMQLLLHVLCHPSWQIRRAAYGSTNIILEAVPKTLPVLLKEFAAFLSAVAECQLLQIRYIHGRWQNVNFFFFFYFIIIVGFFQEYKVL